MAYNLIITKRAEELLDDLIYQLINKYMVLRQEKGLIK